MTPDMEFKPVDMVLKEKAKGNERETIGFAFFSIYSLLSSVYSRNVGITRVYLSAALNTPATNSPGSPGIDSVISIT